MAQISNLLARAIKPGQIISDISAERKTTRPSRPSLLMVWGPFKAPSSSMRLRSAVFPARRCGTYLTAEEPAFC